MFTFIYLIQAFISVAAILLIGRILKLKGTLLEKAGFFAILQFLIQLAGTFVGKIIKEVVPSDIPVLSFSFAFPFLGFLWVVFALILYFLLARENGRKKAALGAGLSVLVMGLLETPMSFIIPILAAFGYPVLFCFWPVAIVAVMAIIYFMIFSEISLWVKGILILELLTIGLGPNRRGPIEVTYVDSETMAPLPNVLVTISLLPEPLLGRKGQYLFYKTDSQGKVEISAHWWFSPFYFQLGASGSYVDFTAYHPDYALKQGHDPDLSNPMGDRSFLGADYTIKLRNLDSWLKEVNDPAFAPSSSPSAIASCFPIYYLKVAKEKDPGFDQAAVIKGWFMKIERDVPDLDTRQKLESFLAQYIGQQTGNNVVLRH